MLAYITWNVNPEIFSIGPFSVRYYGLMWAMAFYIGYIIFNRFVKREHLPEGFLDSLTMYMIVGTVIGARLGHCLFYEPDYYLSNPLEILKIWHGGLASHGAAIGILIALYLFARKYKVPMIYVIDRVVITVAIGGAFIRLGNLFNSEIYGVETTLPWGFIFVRNGEVLPKHPTQLYEALSYTAIFILLYWLYLKADGKLRNGFIFGIFLILLFGARFLIEYVKEPQVEFEKHMMLNMGQWLSLPFIVAGIVFLVYSYIKPSVFIPNENIKPQKGK